MSNVPDLTVITPARDAASTIVRTLASVRRQSRVTIEHIVVDGGSRDATAELAAQAGCTVICGPDAGPFDAMNKGIRAACGRCIHILAADDAYASDDAAATALHALAEQDAVHARVAQVRSDGTRVHVVGRPCTRRQLLRKMRVAHPSLMVRRSVYERFGCYAAGFRCAADHEFVLRIWDRIQVAFLDQVLVEMRIGGLSTRPGGTALALRESCAAAILHGASPLAAVGRMWAERAAHALLFAGRYRS